MQEQNQYWIFLYISNQNAGLHFQIPLQIPVFSQRVSSHEYSLLSVYKRRIISPVPLFCLLPEDDPAYLPGDTCQIFQLRTVTFDPAAVYFNFLFFIHSGQFFADSSQIPYMSCRFLLRRYFLHSQLPICCFTDFRINGELLISLIGKLHINRCCLWLFFSDHKKKELANCG